MFNQGSHSTLLRPGEAAAAIGIRPSTLRVYVQRFGEVLSDDAAAGERPGYRLYGQRDVELLKRARELLGRGFTYERAIAELRPQAGADSRAERRRHHNRRIEVEDVQLAASVQVLDQAIDAWRRLADERAAEIASLREELRELRDMVLVGRRPAQLVRHRQGA